MLADWPLPTEEARQNPKQRHRAPWHSPDRFLQLGGAIDMFYRTNLSKGHHYLVIVESYRAGGKVKQRTIANLGRLDVLHKSGALDRLIASSARFSEKLAVIGEGMKNGPDPLTHRIVGVPLLFGRLWESLRIGEVIRKAAKGRKFGFDLERVIFAAVLQRLTEPGSDRKAARLWFDRYKIDGLGDLQVQHLHRAMRWLGAPVNEDDVVMDEPDAGESGATEEPGEGGNEAMGMDGPDAAESGATGEPGEGENEAMGMDAPDAAEDGGSAPKRAACCRRLKDVLEESIFFKRRNLFTELKLVFFDTTSIYFEGEGGKELGRRGHSKDHRPDLPQTVVGLVLDSFGYPVCSEMWPGNTSDVTTLVPVADRLKARFNIGSVCIVADRGMISKGTIAHLKSMGWFHILGARMRKVKEIREIVLEDDGPYTEIRPERIYKSDPAPLKVKEVIVNDIRYIVCINEEEYRKDKHDRDNIVANLKQALKRGDKSLVGNKGYKRYIAPGKGAFVIDEKKIEEDAKYDGKFVLTSDTELTPKEIALQYKNLLEVESAFRATKSLLSTRPVYHQNDAHIIGHIWCSFLALLMRKALMDAIDADAGKKPRMEWDDMITGLKELTVSRLKSGDKEFELRSEARSEATRAFAALKMRLPDIVKQIANGDEKQPSADSMNEEKACERLA
jgi:hypothetical protein